MSFPVLLTSQVRTKNAFPSWPQSLSPSSYSHRRETMCTCIECRTWSRSLSSPRLSSRLSVLGLSS